MSDEEFLKRWSRRKQEAKEAGETPAPAPPEETAALPVPEAPPAEEVDLSNLPPIDSITATTDVTAFLRENIPLDLSRAALRRAWAADPAIRDFVGLAENAWDFTDPTAMAGFGPLEHTPEQIAALVERIVGGVRDTAEKLASEIGNEAQNHPENSETVQLSGAAETVPDPSVTAATVDDEHGPAVAAVQPQGSDGEEDEAPLRRRSHGGALPS